MHKSCLCRCPLEYNSACSIYPHTKQPFTIIWCLKLWPTKDINVAPFSQLDPLPWLEKRASNFRLTLGPFQYTVAMAITPGRPRVQSWSGNDRDEPEGATLFIFLSHSNQFPFYFNPFFNPPQTLSCFLFCFCFFLVFIGALESRTHHFLVTSYRFFLNGLAPCQDRTARENSK